MSKVLRVRTYGEEVLRQKAKSIERITDEIRTLVEDMKETMREYNGVGLAAPQVGESVRLIIIDPREEQESENGKYPLALINPEILSAEGECEFEEGCLSIPGIYRKVRRPEKVVVKYTDMDGKIHEIEDEDVLSRVLQHEIDHLDGVLFVDHLSTLAKLSIAKKLKEIEKKNV